MYKVSVSFGLEENSVIPDKSGSKNLYFYEGTLYYDGSDVSCKNKKPAAK